MLHETWKDQYDRMKRSSELLKQIGEPTPERPDVIPARDLLYHFCCDAFHLRDWIAATVTKDRKTFDSTVKQLDEELIKTSDELSACRDIANRFKHLTVHSDSFLSGANHAEVVSGNIGIGVPVMVAVVTKAVMKFIRGDGPEQPDPVDAKDDSPATAAQTPTSTGGYVQYTFDIEINSQRHDARHVAARAIEAWDNWLKGNSAIAAQLRETEAIH